MGVVVADCVSTSTLFSTAPKNGHGRWPAARPPPCAALPARHLGADDEHHAGGHVGRDRPQSVTAITGGVSMMIKSKCSPSDREQVLEPSRRQQLGRIRRNARRRCITHSPGTSVFCTASTGLGVADQHVRQPRLLCESKSSCTRGDACRASTSSTRCAGLRQRRPPGCSPPSSCPHRARCWSQRALRALLRPTKRHVRANRAECLGKVRRNAVVDERLRADPLLAEGAGIMPRNGRPR